MVVVSDDGTTGAIRPKYNGRNYNDVHERLAAFNTKRYTIVSIGKTREQCLGVHGNNNPNGEHILCFFFIFSYQDQPRKNITVEMYLNLCMESCCGWGHGCWETCSPFSYLFSRAAIYTSIFAFFFFLLLLFVRLGGCGAGTCAVNYLRGAHL